MEKRAFGVTNQGQETMLYTLKNGNHTTVRVSDFGAALVSFSFLDKQKIARDVVLGYDEVKEYQNHSSYFGAVIGRCGNRIENGRMVIDGKVWKVEENENGNSLHSGANGFHNVVWEVKNATDNSITFSHLSTQEEQGFPGNLRAEVTYTLTEKDAVEITYQGTADADTVMNFTNHSYFNLGGHDSGSVLNQQLQIPGESYTPVRDSQSIPTGEIAPVERTPMDFRSMKPIGRDIEADFEQLVFTGGYDHNYIVSEEPGEMKVMAKAYCEETGIAMEASTDCCGVQFYAGNGIGSQIGKNGAVYKNRCGFCLESQFYPNSVNQKNFASPIVKAGENYHSKTIYRLFIK